MRIVLALFSERRYILFFPSEISKPVRVQKGAFVSDEEVSNVVDYLKQNIVEEVVYNEI